MTDINLGAYFALVGFGDSLADSGNADILAGIFFDPTPAAQGYEANRFSNGPNYFDLAFGAISGADALGYAPALDPNASGANGLNYAVGGARAVEDFSLQIDVFAGQVGSGRLFGVEAREGTLVAINLGGNDLLEFASANADGVITAAETSAIVASVSGAIAAGVTELAGLGAINVLVAGVPNVGATPEVTNAGFGGDTAASSAAFDPVTEAVNAGLGAALLDLRLNDPDLEIFYFQPDFDPLLEDPAALGLDPALLSVPFVDDLSAGRATLGDIDDYAFMDGVHPTAAVQAQFFAQAQSALLVGSTVTAGDDVVVGSRGADVLTGLMGNDMIIGGQGSDYLLGDGVLA